MGRHAAIVSSFNRLPPWVVDAALAGVAVATLVSERLATTPLARVHSPSRRCG